MRGLERDDLFTVVFEQVRTDTVPYADVRAAGDHVPRALRHQPQLRRPRDAARQAGDRAGRRVAAERRRLQRAARSGSGCRTGPTEDETEALLHVARRLPDGRRRASCSPTASPSPPGGDQPDPVRRRASADTPTARSTSSPPTSPTLAPGGLYSYQADPATDDSPAGADLAGQREDDQLDARRAADAAGGAAHAPRRRGGARRRAPATPSASSTRSARCTAWSRSATASREGTVSLAEGPVAAQLVQPVDRHGAGARRP